MSTMGVMVSNCRGLSELSSPSRKWATTYILHKSHEFVTNLYLDFIRPNFIFFLIAGILLKCNFSSASAHWRFNTIWWNIHSLKTFNSVKSEFRPHIPHCQISLKNFWNFIQYFVKKKKLCDTYEISNFASVPLWNWAEICFFKTKIEICLSKLCAKKIS